MRSLKLRQLPNTVDPLAGVLFKGSCMSQAVRGQLLMEDAKRCARLIVRYANRDADAWREQAETAGYEAGFARAIVQVAQCLDQIEAQRATLHEHAVATVRQMLEGLLDDQDVLLRIVNTLANGDLFATDIPLRVVLPEHARRAAPAVRECLKATYPSVQVAVGNARKFIVEAGECVLEFDPHEITHQISEAALQACRAAANATADDALALRAATDALRKSTKTTN